MRDEARAGPQRAARREPRRAGEATDRPRPPPHGRAIFVAVGRGHRKALRPQRRGVGEGLRRRCRRARASGMPMSATAHRSGMQPARQQQMARLAAEEGHGFARRAPPRPSPRRSSPLMPLGRSTATTGTPARVDRLDHRPRRALDRPVEAGAEQRIDDEAGARRAPSGVAASTGPCQRARRLGGIALELVATRRAAAAAPDSRARRGPARRRSRRRHCCRARRRRKPSARRAGSLRATASATARPAFSISRMPGVPAAIVSRSASAISAVVSSSIMAAATVSAAGQDGQRDGRLDHALRSLPNRCARAFQVGPGRVPQTFG